MLQIAGEVVLGDATPHEQRHTEIQRVHRCQFGGGSTEQERQGMLEQREGKDSAQRDVDDPAAPLVQLSTVSYHLLQQHQTAGAQQDL